MKRRAVQVNISDYPQVSGIYPAGSERRTEMRQAVDNYIKKKYKVAPEFPWRKYDGNAVFRHTDNNKWFALVMNVQGDRVGLPEEEYVDVINLKMDDMIFRDMILQEEGIHSIRGVGCAHHLPDLANRPVSRADAVALSCLQDGRAHPLP